MGGPLLAAAENRTITKDPAGAGRANLVDYAAERQVFRWDEARAALDGLPGGGLNIAYEAVDRHAAGPAGARVAIRWLGKHGDTSELTYAALAEHSSRFANALATLGIGKGDRVFTLIGRRPELYVAALGTLKHRAVLSPLFSAFGPEPVRQRLELGDARVLVTSSALYRKKVAGIRDALPRLEHIVVVDDGADAIPGGHDYATLLATAAPSYEIGPTDPEDMALLHFTSGTTGTPKGAVHVHGAVVAHAATARYALDLQRDDVFWCTADPGWVTGTSYGVIAPLVTGVTVVVDEAEIDVRRWYQTLQDQRVTVWYTAPTALRMLMKAGTELPRSYDLSALRFIASVGEPLNPEVVWWGQDALGLPIHDNWWQTETGGIMIANFAACDIRPGSMGRPIPGIDAALAVRGADGRAKVSADAIELLTTPGEIGELVLKRGWPSMFRGYLNNPERYAQAFAGQWYLSGDLARVDEDGYFWFVGRADDVIKTAGHLIGPFEVESALLEHPAVAEAGVIGVPDPMAGEIIKAFVALRPPYEPNEGLRLELLGWGRKRLGAAVAPREIEFATDLPRTRSGKIMRRLLKARELGLPEGDVSTLEGQSS